MNAPLDLQALENLIRHFTSDEHVVPLGENEAVGTPPLTDSMMLQPRLERAAMNHLTDGDATLSRYAIWAETVRGIVLEALEQAEAGSDARLHLTRAANSLGAFISIQGRLSPL